MRGVYEGYQIQQKWAKQYIGVREQMYSNKGQDAGVDTVMTGEWSYYPIPRASIPVHSEKSPARPMLFYSTNYWQQFWV